MKMIINTLLINNFNYYINNFVDVRINIRPLDDIKSR